MKYVRYGVVLFVAAGMLHFARSNSQEKSRPVSHTENGVSFEFRTIPKSDEAVNVRINVTITGRMDSLWRPVLRSSKYGFDESTGLYKYETKPLILSDSAAGTYFADLGSGGKNNYKYYFFEIRDNVGRPQARVFDTDGKPFRIRVVGQIPVLLLIIHILALSAGTFFGVLGANHAIGATRTGGDMQPMACRPMTCRPMARSFLWSAVSFFAAAYPIGIAMNQYAFGLSWGGVPFGTIIADNKLQLLLGIMLFMTATMLGSLRPAGWGRDIFTARITGWLAVGTAAIMLAIYMIPNHIRLESELVQASCYSFFGLLSILYLVGLYASRPQREVEKPRKMRNRTQQTG